MKSKQCPLDLLVVSVVFSNDTSGEQDREENVMKPGLDGQGLAPLMAAGPITASR